MTTKYYVNEEINRWIKYDQKITEVDQISHGVANIGECFDEIYS